MKIVLLCAVALVMVVQLPREGDAVCCYGKGLVWNLRCKDCSKAAPFCAKGKSCNIFGCNCMGGCREGPCPSPYNHHVKPVVEAPVGRDYESSYGRESDAPASNDYDVPAAVDSSASESEMSASNDYEVPETVVSSDSEPEMSASNDYEVTASDVSSGSESETNSLNGYDSPMGYLTSDDGDYGSESEITSAEDVVSTADENGDGYMDIDEAERFLVKRGLAASGYRAKRSLRAIDLNNDNFISAEEIELYED